MAKTTQKTGRLVTAQDRQRMVEASKLAAAVYNPPGRQSVDGYTIIDFRDDRDTGFRAAAYRDNKTGEVFVGFAGTDLEKTYSGSLRQDMVENTGVALGQERRQMRAARAFVRALAKEHKDLHLLGHSLGGYLAQMAVQDGVKKLTIYQAPGLRDRSAIRPELAGLEAAPLIYPFLKNEDLYLKSVYQKQEETSKKVGADVLHVHPKKGWGVGTWLIQRFGEPLSGRLVNVDYEPETQGLAGTLTGHGLETLGAHLRSENPKMSYGSLDTLGNSSRMSDDPAWRHPYPGGKNIQARLDGQRTGIKSQNRAMRDQIDRPKFMGAVRDTLNDFGYRGLYDRRAVDEYVKGAYERAFLKQEARYGNGAARIYDEDGTFTRDTVHDVLTRLFSQKGILLPDAGSGTPSLARRRIDTKRRSGALTRDDVGDLMHRLR